MDAMVAYTAIRNPFEIGDPVPLPNAGSDLGDLSWTYHLTSISLFGAERVATIDGKDYRVGDRLGDMHHHRHRSFQRQPDRAASPLVQKTAFPPQSGRGASC